MVVDDHFRRVTNTQSLAGIGKRTGTGKRMATGVVRNRCREINVQIRENGPRKMTVQVAPTAGADVGKFGSAVDNPQVRVIDTRREFFY